MYHYFQKTILKNPEASIVETHYDKGFVFTREAKNQMSQISSIRVQLAHFFPSSENRRILKKSEAVEVSLFDLPLKNYHWSIAKMGSDFYRDKFGEGVMSANKIREMFTNQSKSNMNAVFEYSSPDTHSTIGYSLSFKTSRIIHYGYPFYDQNYKSNLGMTMMLRAIICAKENNYEYIYLGTEKKYKLQFKGVETFDGERWIKHLEI